MSPHVEQTRTATASSHPGLSLAAFITNIAESDFRYTQDGKPRPRRIWSKIPDKIETAIVNLALEEPNLSPRELAVNFTDTKGRFVSEATVYRLLKDHGLIN